MSKADGPKRRWTDRLPATTGIGSLPHHNVDAALAFSFGCSIPFLPQIPIRNALEFMIPQALEGMPGLEISSDGSTVLDLDAWTAGTHQFNEKLLEAFASAARPDAFSSFEPSAAAASAWPAFLWELEERRTPVAKIQLAGPLTSQWALTLKTGGRPDDRRDIAAQVFRLVLARAIAMGRRLQASGIQPILFLDEPGLYGFSPGNPRQVLAFSELKIVVQALKKEGVAVGLHCCSDTDWPAVLKLGLDVLSLDAGLSLDRVLPLRESREFVKQGGVLSLGVVPTSVATGAATEPALLFAHTLGIFEKHWGDDTDLIRKTLKGSLYTPACGLALQPPDEAENIHASVNAFVRLLG